MIYFDNAATTYPKPQEVYEALNYAALNYGFNAGRGSYAEAVATFNMIEDTRRKMGNLLNVNKDKVVFLSSATEALNDIIYGLIKSDDEVFISPFEHNAVVRTLYNIKAHINIIPFDSKTFTLDINKFNDLLVLKKPKAIIISQVSNVTGFMLPYEEIFKLGKQYETINILDSAQALGEYKINKENCDLVVFAGHKSLYATFGVAGYYNLTNVNLKPIKVGGTGSDSLNLAMPEDTPSRYEAGSSNALAIYTLNKSLDVISQLNIAKQKENLTSYLLEKLKQIRGLTIYLPANYVSCGIVSFNLKDYKASDVGMILAEDFQICVRTGYHCAPLINDFLNLNKYSGTVRVSLGMFNTKDEIDVLIEALREM